MAKDAEALSLASFKKSLEWNGKLPQAVQTLVHSLIHDQAVKNGEAQAVCSWDGDLTYAELDALSSRLGTYLGTHGVGPEVIVPLCFEKSKWAIVAILGVLKAGGAFLLLDPSQPIARLESIVKQTGAKLALSSVECFDTCKILIKQVFVIDGTSISSLESSNTSAIQPGATPGNAAYYIFTSGSTGNPKGVAIENSSLSTTATNIAERLGYGSGSRVFQFASYAFDACITDIFGTLASGATLCIPSEWERNNGIVGALRRMNVDNAKFTPSLATNLAFEDVPTFKTLVLGGESCPPSLLEKWSRKIRMILVYGPTECCVICFTADASQQATVASEIGRTVGARAWIVKQDNYNELAQIGETGELLIEGPLVARGYLNDKAKTEQQFIQNPLWMIGHQKQSRMYRTGDLASYLDDGRVCYAGRIDNQVKIRGQRLELEEVESKMHDALAQIGKAGSKRVIVDAVIFSGLSSKQLVAFVCPDESESIGSLDWHLENGREINTTSAEQERFSSLVSALEESLRLLLPIYAVPTVWIPLKSLPLTISRKADRRRLRDIVSDFSVKQLGIFTQKPSDLTAQGHELNDHGQKLQALWANVFNVVSSTIEAGDNFFSLGGDSVMAIKLIAAARSKGLDLTLDIVFKHPVLYDMSVFTKDLVISKEDLAIIPPFGLLDQSLDANVVCREASKACSIPMECIDDIYPCSPMQEGLLALSMKDPGTYILQFVYQMPKSIDLDRLKSAWKAVAKHAQVLRTRFFDFDSGLYQVVVDQPMNWGVVDGDLDKFFSSEKERGLKFGEPMSRHTVLRQHHKGSTEYFLIWTIHHALIDGWSESDITTAVEAEYLGKASTISKAPRYNKFINYINKQDQESGRQFWLDQLEDAPVPVFPPLPSSSYVPKVERSNRIDHHLEEHAEAELKHNVPSFKKGSVTPATMIQAAWFILLGIYSDASDVVTGLTLNGRAAQLPGIDSIPGPTVTTIPFRTRLSPDMKLTELLQNTQDQYLSIIPFSQFGLHNIRRLSEGAIAACKFRTLLVVQSANNSKNSRQLLLGRSYFFPVMDFALVMECELQGDTIDFRATFDHQILREEEVRRIFQQMADILRRMSLSDSDTEVFELQKISDSDLSQIKKWNSSTDQVDSGQSDITWLVDPGHTNNLIPIGGVGEIVVQDPTAERVYLHGLFLDTSNLIDTPDWYKSDNLATEPKFAKTGVLAKYLWDGVLSPLGRKEDQVAIQGQRVDVTEVEDQLREAISRHSLSEPQGLAITTISGSEGKPLLAAFMAVDEDGVDGNVEPLVLPEDTKGLEKFHVLVEEVDTDLRSKIPDHKIPQLYIPVNISHLENGWSDRLLLQKLAFGLPPAELAKYRVAKSTTSSSQAPSTALEKKIHTLWKGLLNIDQIGVEDNFFRLGGGSVLAMRLVSMARREGITMTVSGIFKTPTLRELALTVQEDTDVIDIAAFSLLDSSSVADLKRQAAAQCAVTEEEIEDIYPCSAMQLHYITGYPGANKTMHDPWDWQSQATYSLSPTIDLDRFIAAWNVAISRHLTLRTMILNTSSGILQVVLTEPKEPVWHYAKNLHQYEEDDKANAMGFGTPLLRLGIISTPGSEQRHFVMTIHHTIYDAFARSMLFKEIESLYESPNSLSTGSLPKMNIFIKYITTDADKTSALDFWASKLSDLTTKPLLKIPEHPILPLEIQEHTVTTPLSRPNSKTYTLPTLLEVAVAITLSHHLSTPTVILYSDRSGRNLPVPGLTDLIGPTTLLLPVPITISPDQTIQSLLESAQHFQTEMLPHEHLGFVELLELPTLAPTLKNAINMNINPRRLAGMGKGLGLTFEGSSAGCDDPFGINVDVDEEVRELSWCVYWDERFIEKESVKALLGDVIRTFEKLVEGNGGRKVSEVWG